MLATDAHGGFGGIAQYNRDVLDALSQSDRIEKIVVLPRIVAEPIVGVPNKVTYKAFGARGMLEYLWGGLYQATAGGRFNLIYCAHINLMPLAAVLARIQRVPVLLAIYGIDAWAPPRGSAARLAARVPRLTMSISAVTLHRFQAWSGGVSNTAVVPNAIRTERYGPGQKRQDLIHRFGLAGRKVIMTFGRMWPSERYKGFDEVIEVLPRIRTKHPEITYVAAGDGPDRPRLEAKARELGVADVVVFPGRIPESEKADMYRLADAYIMPSSGEGFGFVVIEALACGIPVVASRTDGTLEAVQGGELGLTVDPGDSAELESAILAALTRPKAVPAGLAYFHFSNFAKRVEAAVCRASGDDEPIH